MPYEGSGSEWAAASLLRFSSFEILSEDHYRLARQHMEKELNCFFHIPFIINKGKFMEKQSQCRWKKVCTRKSTGQTPVPRWGHTCCVIQDEMVFFGGYAGTHLP